MSRVTGTLARRESIEADLVDCPGLVGVSLAEGARGPVGRVTSRKVGTCASDGGQSA